MDINMNRRYIIVYILDHMNLIIELYLHILEVYIYLPALYPICVRSFGVVHINMDT